MSINTKYQQGKHNRVSKKNIREYPTEFELIISRLAGKIYGIQVECKKFTFHTHTCKDNKCMINC